MAKTVLCMLLTLGILYVVPFVVYSVFSAVGALKPPEDVSPAVLLTSFLVEKVGHAVAFVLLFYLARSTFGGRWLLYAAIWWVMFVLGEVGQALTPKYTWMEALAGIISETIYLPLAALATSWLLAPE